MLIVIKAHHVVIHALIVQIEHKANPGSRQNPNKCRTSNIRFNHIQNPTNHLRGTFWYDSFRNDLEIRSA